MNKTKVDCLICRSGIKTSELKNDLFSMKSVSSNIPVITLIEKVLKNNSLGKSKKSKCCFSCLQKINKYDKLIEDSRKLEKELQAIYTNAVKDQAILEDSNNEESPKKDSSSKIKIEVKSDEIRLSDGKVYYVTEITKPIDDDDIMDESTETLGIIDGSTETLDAKNMDGFHIEYEEVNIKNENEDDLLDDLIEESYSNNGDYDDDDYETKYNVTEDIENNSNENIAIETVTIDLPKKGRQPKRVKSQGINTCEECELDFPTDFGLRRHKKQVHPTAEDKLTLFCHICGLNFPSNAKLNLHITGVHNLHPFSCKICGKKFTQKGALKRHYFIHTGEKPFQCEQCGKQFTHYSSFHMHKLAHDDIREKACKICGLKLRSSSHLNRHMLVHTGQKPHECPKCGQRFAQRYNMMVHMKSHDGVQTRRNRNYICEICHVVFPKNSLLAEHKQNVHNVLQLKSTFSRVRQYEASIAGNNTGTTEVFQAGINI